ncbi:MAG: hypothetical protein CMJ58_03685 [Planctomycetaceae bacterium]|nr:hypothetical protein [Planctomycetaceae bacterium]
MTDTPASPRPHAPETLVERLDALYEYEREPVTADKLHGWRTFIAMFSSEHIAGTEFVLGVLLVQHGVTAFDVFAGLALGNLLAVLSWALMCAPIAVRERLTVYWQIRKVAGPYLTVLYSGLLALILCLLAGAMVSVSTTAVAKTIGVTSPDYAAGDRVPSAPWIAIAIGVGTVIAVLAVLGFERLAHFAKVVAPWMPFVFLAGGIASLPKLGVTSLSDFWEVANEKIWTGQAESGHMQYGFWSCVGLAWLCNISQHMGMGDVTIFRYAKKWQMGFCSAFGMFLGHYMAWICSGIMCAAFKETSLAAGIANPNPTPANIALLGAGYAGIVCVLLAGWTTANPTLYRAGLAFQVATPNWRRWVVTLVAGVLMIVIACIPAVLHFLDRIVAYYGLFFMPLGAFIFIDFWIFPRLGLTHYYAEKKRLLVSWPAAVGWFGSFGICFVLYAKDNYQSMAWINDRLPARLASYHADLFSQVLPAWILAVTLYTACSLVQQKLQHKDDLSRSVPETAP